MYTVHNGSSVDKVFISFVCYNLSNDAVSSPNYAASNGCIIGLHEELIRMDKKKAAAAFFKALSSYMHTNSNKKHDNCNQISRYTDTNFKPRTLTNFDNLTLCRTGGTEPPSWAHCMHETLSV
jgi:hypothetical protein